MLGYSQYSLINLHYDFVCLQGSRRGGTGGQAMGNTTETDSSDEGYGEGRGMTDHSALVELGESDEETTGHDNLTDSFAGDMRERTDGSFLNEWINKTIRTLPNNNAVTARNMQPILRTVSALNEWLLRYGLRKLFYAYAG